jgi:hypothetical protein
VIDANKLSQTHLTAAHEYTVLKHDTRFLTATSEALSEEKVIGQARDLHNRYNKLIRTTPPTSGWIFKMAAEDGKGRDP